MKRPMKGILPAIFLLPVIAGAVEGDMDNDGVLDHEDNCSKDWNPSQKNYDDPDLTPDAFGNICDQDLNQDGIVFFTDLQLFYDCYGRLISRCDFNADQDVDGDDLVIMIGNLWSKPGPGAIPLPPPPSGTITLTWNAVTQNEDNTELVDLAGYKIYCGTESEVYNSPTSTPPEATTYLVQFLSPDTYYCVVSAYDYAGNESSFSNETSKVVL